MATRVTGILGKKVGMTQLFDSKGDVRPVTVLQAGPCVVTQHKSAVRDGYEAAQIGLVEFVKQSRLTKPAQGHLAKSNLPFGGGPKSHGSMFQITGSIGSSAFPSRVFKGMRMSGHMGHDRVTQRNLRVLGVDKDENLLVVEGSVPGPQGGYIVITKSKKPPRERRGFAGSATVDPLKAAKRAAKKA
jgi:large subunit ribosomal protein L3